MEVDIVESEKARQDMEADSEVEDAMKSVLKRSCSAPLINQLVEDVEGERAGQAAAIIHSAAQRLRPSGYVTGSCRWRRASTSYSPVSPGAGPSGGGVHTQGQGAGWARLNRLKVEETEDLGKLEIQTEREVQRGISIENNLSQSWEDLSLCDSKDSSVKAAAPIGAGARRATDPMVPLTIGVGPFPSPRTSPSPSPSPTRSSSGSSCHPGKQCFSPSMQKPVPNLSFSPSPSSSPTRRGWATRRSLSPITLRPSPLGPVKRKCMLDSDSEREAGVTPSKRHSSLLSITHQNSFRSAPYRLPAHVSAGWATPSSSPSHSTCSRESSPVGPCGEFHQEKEFRSAEFHPSVSSEFHLENKGSPALSDMDTSSSSHQSTETAL